MTRILNTDEHHAMTRLLTGWGHDPKLVDRLLSDAVLGPGIIAIGADAFLEGIAFRFDEERDPELASVIDRRSRLTGDARSGDWQPTGTRPQLLCSPDGTDAVVAYTIASPTPWRIERTFLLLVSEQPPDVMRSLAKCGTQLWALPQSAAVRQAAEHGDDGGLWGRVLPLGEVEHANPELLAAINRAHQRASGWSADRELLLRYDGIHGIDGLCHIRTYQYPGHLPVVIAGELAHNPGTILANAIETVAATIQARLYDDGREFTLIQYRPRDEFLKVTFEPHTLGEPRRADDYTHHTVLIGPDGTAETRRGPVKPGDFRNPQWARIGDIDALLGTYVQTWEPDEYTAGQIGGSAGEHLRDAFAQHAHHQANQLLRDLQD